MNREYKPTSRLLPPVFAACAVTITVGVFYFIELLASDHGTYVALLARAITTQG